MDALNSLFLSQTYKDSLEDYRRSLKNAHFPKWDHVVITASNDSQAEGFRKQIELRKPFLPAGTEFVVIPDRDGKRVGSGGATLSVLKHLKEKDGSFEGRKTLVIHSGGDSKRVPQYSALGKLFSPVPHELPDGRAATLFDEILISMSGLPARIREGMVLLSGDVLLLFNPLQVDYSGHGAAAISFKEKVEIGKNHGVYLNGPDGNVRRCLQKKSVEELRAFGAVNESGYVDIDTGAVIFSAEMQEALYGLVASPEGYDRYVNDQVRLSLYADFLYPLGSDATLEAFYEETPEGVFSQELLQARRKVWEVLRPFRMKLLQLAPAKFVHFGTTREVLTLMNEGVTTYAALGWSGQVKSSVPEAVAAYQSVMESGAIVDEGCYLELAEVRGGAHIGSGSVVSCVTLDRVVIPDHVVVHGLRQRNGSYVVRIYGTGDNPKENRLFGQDLDQLAEKLKCDLWEGLGSEEPHSLWTAQLYPEMPTMEEAVHAAVMVYEMVSSVLVSPLVSSPLVSSPLVSDTNWGMLWKTAKRKSLASGFNDASPEFGVDWLLRMADLVKMDEIRQSIRCQTPMSEMDRIEPLSEVQREVLREYVAQADFGEGIRLYYYLGTLSEDDTLALACFQTIRDEILKAQLGDLSYRTDIQMVMDKVQVQLPLRVNWGGGWSDTPPYCNENGGTVLNAAILLNGKKPVEVTIERISERKIIFDSRDMDVHGEFDRLEELQSVGDPYDPFVLQKAGLIACGVIPWKAGIGSGDDEEPSEDLKMILDRMGGGFVMHSEVTDVPKGSGLGTSSILAAACVKAVSECFGLHFEEAELYERVLVMEQIMSTGGGWQDQIGGLMPGVKFITSGPGLKQEPMVETVDIPTEMVIELNERLALIYTGQRRLARYLLRDVVGRYLGNEPDSLYALGEIQKVAALMRQELERGDVDAFASLLNRHWELSKLVDGESTNTLIEQIFASIADLIDGRMICGAGGGGFLQVIMKRGVTCDDLERRLREVFMDYPVAVYSCALYVHSDLKGSSLCLNK